MREIKEEANVSVTDYGTEETCKVEKPPIGVLHLHIYTGVKISGEPLPGNEVEEIKWFEVEFAKQNRYYIQPEQEKNKQ
jgi:8-oxo-dGTP pyrophosphatase MutT (NUDIX family)